MLRKIILVILFQVMLFGSYNTFRDDVEKYLEKDFLKFGIEYNRNANKIIFSENRMLFQNGEDKIQKPFKLVLNDFFPRYLELLIKHKVNIKNVIIKGHTSSENRRGHTIIEKNKLNQILSQKRADNFLHYSQNIKNDTVKKNFHWIKSHFISKGVSSKRLIYDNNGKENVEASRRIELEIIFNQELKKVSDNPIFAIKNHNSVYLADYIKRLLLESPTLKEKYNLLKSFEKDRKIAEAAFYPTVTLNFNQTHYSESKPDKFTNVQSKDVTVRYNIFNGFRDLEENNIRKYVYKSNEYLNEQIENDLIFSLTESFLNISKEKEILHLSELNLKDYDLWIAKEDVKFQNGMISLRNYAKIESRDTIQRMNHKELYKKFQDNVSTFKRYIDLNEDEINNFEKLNLQHKYFEDEELAYKDIQRYSPYMKESMQIIKMYKEKLEQSKVHFYPIIDLVAKKSSLNEHYKMQKTDETDETSIALIAKLELYSGGKDSANNEKKLFEYREKIAKKESVARDLQYKLNLVFNRYNLAKKKENLLKKLILKRENSLLGASYDYKFAKIDANKLLDSVDDLYNAKKLYIENKYALLISKYKILNNIGLIKKIILENQIKE